jgi:hypothetical protein
VESEMIYARGFIRRPVGARNTRPRDGRKHTSGDGMPTLTLLCITARAMSRRPRRSACATARTAALDRRPRRTTPHHVADHSQEQSSPHNHLPIVIAPHETKTQKPGAVTLVIVPQTAGMPHRPL